MDYRMSNTDANTRSRSVAVDKHTPPSQPPAAVSTHLHPHNQLENCPDRSRSGFPQKASGTAAGVGAGLGSEPGNRSVVPASLSTRSPTSRLTRASARNAAAAAAAAATSQAGSTGDEDPLGATWSSRPSSAATSTVSASANRQAQTPSLPSSRPTQTPVPAQAPAASASRKRKPNSPRGNSQTPLNEGPSSSSARQPKRQKVSESAAAPAAAQGSPPTASTKPKRKGKAKAAAAMSTDNPGPAMQANTPVVAATAAGSSVRKSSRNKRTAGQVAQDPSAPTPSSMHRSKKTATTVPQPSEDNDTAMGGTDDQHTAAMPGHRAAAGDQDDGSDDHDEEDDDPHRHYEDEDPFGGFGGPGGPAISNTLRALSGMMSGTPSRLREILANMRLKEDPSMQMIALQDLSEILLVSNEDNLAGHFSPDTFVKELVTLMQANEITGEENPEMMLLACRSLANLMEALPASTANVVYGGAVPVLCAKLLEIHFIDLAEQALSTLEKISVDYPTSIVREGGLTACLTFLDFFATSTQRTAVTTAANCCRNIPEESFGVVKDVIPILLNVLGSNDQRVVEQGSLCVTRIIESFKYHSSKLEELVSVDLLKAILRLLVPGTTNLIGANIHTQFLRVLAITARASPRLSAELFKLNVVETLYQILTGVSPPDETEDVASKLDSVVIMQALIHRPRDQIIETLNVVCELLPGLIWDERTLKVYGQDAGEAVRSSSPIARKKTSSEKRLELLDGCKDQVRRFALILFPTLTDAFSSTVNLSVRQKVLTAQLKMLSNLDKDILVDALRSVPYASFLAAILSQQDHPSLVMYAMQATELLLARLDDIYRYQIYREGVIAEITKLAEGDPPTIGLKGGPAVLALRGVKPKEQEASAMSASEPVGAAAPEVGVERDRGSSHDDSDADDDEDDDPREHEDEEDHDDEDEDHEQHEDDMSGSPASSDDSAMSVDGPSRTIVTDIPTMKTKIVQVAKAFLQSHETENQSKPLKRKATKILTDLQALATDMQAFYLHRTGGNLAKEHGTALFERLSAYFEAAVLEGVTSAELLASGLVRVLEEVFSNPDEFSADAARGAFLEVFMSRSLKSQPESATSESPATPFGVLVHKLQDLLSRSEHFEVLTVHQHTFDGNRSSATSMLAKQIRLKLVADDASEIPKTYRNVMVSIHAIATFKSLDDYLRPRISMHERPRGSRRDGLTRALAAMAGSAGMPPERLAERLGYASNYGSAPPAPPTQASSSSRSVRKTKSRTSGQSAAPPVPSPPAESAKEKGGLRRSSRRHGASSGESQAPPPPPPAPPAQEDDLQNALECADERPLSDDDDELAARNALDAIVGEIDDEMNDAPTPGEPSAVNLEVAAGGKITARKEDGTRVPTPSQSGSVSLSSRSAGLPPSGLSQQSTPTHATSSRPLSYAAAVQSVPQDWHIAFSLDDKAIPSETTIYQAVHKSSGAGDDQHNRNIWSTIHPVKFKRVAGPPPVEAIGFAPPDNPPDENGVPGSLVNHPTTSSILRLLNILHDLNANVEDILIENKTMLQLNVEPPSQFVNTKLTAKLNRQLEEPLIVASNCLPGWTEDLTRLYPFLFPFETRHLFLQSTSFGYARSMTRWQNAHQEENSRLSRREERPFLGRLQRQKVRISRSKILESALKVMELYGASQSILEVEYFEEVGTGLGPTLEFYSTVSKEFSKKKLKLWREMDCNDSDEFVSGSHGLFPRPLAEFSLAANTDRILHMFKMMGKFVARSMIDSRIIDLNFNPIFFRIGDGTSGVKPSLGAIKVVDRVLASSLKHIKKFALAKKEIEEDPGRSPAQKVADIERIVIDNTTIDDVALDFTMPGYPEIELISHGSNTPVTIHNVDLYLDKVLDMTLGSGVKRQLDAFRAGFSQVFPYSALSAFTPAELVLLFGRTDEDWSLETLMDSIKADHGFNMDSKTVKNLLQTMSELEPAQRRDFLQFTTGSPKLPIGGFKALTPMFTVVCKPSEPPFTSDDYLPSVMTCVNYLKLPDYSSIESMRKQLFTAIREGQGAFHLS